MYDLYFIFLPLKNESLNISYCIFGDTVCIVIIHMSCECFDKRATSELDTLHENSYHIAGIENIGFSFIRWHNSYTHTYMGIHFQNQISQSRKKLRVPLLRGVWHVHNGPKFVFDLETEPPAFAFHFEISV